MHAVHITGGTVIGREHAAAGRNSQDAYAWHMTDTLLAAAVCDGCSGGRSSELGAKLGSKLLVARILDRWKPVLNNGDPEEWDRWLDTVRQDVLAELRLIALRMPGSFSQAVTEHFLFTVIALVMTPEVTCIFSLGDGVLAFNGRVTKLTTEEKNQPPYLAYALLEEGRTPFAPEKLKFRIEDLVPTEMVDTILLGTDGVADLIMAETRQLPGKEEAVGPLSQFWTNDRFFTNPDMVRRRLFLMNRASASINADGGLEHHHGLLPDDTTIVVMRREQESK